MSAVQHRSARFAASRGYRAYALALSDTELGLLGGVAFGVFFYLFLVNLVSMGLGPVAVGFSTDRLGTSLGDDALRYSLLAIVSSTSAVASWLFLVAARTLPRDLTQPRDAVSARPPASLEP